MSNPVRGRLTRPGVLRGWMTAAVLTVTVGCGAAHARTAAVRTAGPVVVYGSTSCAFTAAARTYLGAHHVAMVFRDVERDPDAMDAMARRVQESGQEYRGIPVIDVHGTVLVGYDAQTLAEALDE